MDKETRNRIQKATQAARQLLEEEYREQIEGIYSIFVEGRIADDPGEHLHERERLIRNKIVAAIQHHEAGGKKLAEAIATYLREAAFTTLNRFVALEMLEARELVQPCVSAGEESSGFKEFSGLAPGLLQLPDHGYRLYVESLYDEIGREVKVLFDRRDAASLLWPRRPVLLDLLEILNDGELEGVWREDETIGWVYQYFNSAADREKARYDAKGKPKSPQNGYELAVRNQFFTPRYVVQFLTDNTLGQTWYEMSKGQTALAEQLEYRVRHKDEVFLGEGEDVPEDEGDTRYLRHRPKKDPRDLRILDPACGSGHFLLYCFDLLLVIYEEAWADESSPGSETTGRTLRENYQSIDELRRAIPGLTLEHNLHGIDIDPRAAQIAGFALWMRAQRAFRDLGFARDQRPLIRKTNVVVAEAMPGEDELLHEFTTTLDPPLLGQIMTKIVDELKLAGEAGSLLRVRETLAGLIGKAKEQWTMRPPAEQTALFPQLRRPTQEALRFDLSGITDQEFWNQAERHIVDALARYAAATEGAEGYRRRLFAHDAARGFAFLDVLSKRFDVVLMNPPFGDFTGQGKKYAGVQYARTKNDIYAAFVEMGVSSVHSRGFVGAITSRTGFFLSSFQKWREEILLKEAHPTVFADLGYGVLDDAMVEVAAYCLESAA